MSKTINDIITAADKAQGEGVPVDWRALCYQVLNVATAHIGELEKAAETPDQPDHE